MNIQELKTRQNEEDNFQNLKVDTSKQTDSDYEEKLQKKVLSQIREGEKGKEIKKENEATESFTLKEKGLFGGESQLSTGNGYGHLESDLLHRYSLYDDFGSSSLLDSLSIGYDETGGGGGTDDMNEMDMPNPGSIQHFQRLFYPSVPCKNCASCYQKFTREIFGD